MNASQSQFKLMAQHGAGVRVGTPGGTVVLSRLPGGRSQIAGQAPSVKFVLQGEETYTIAGRTRRVGPGEFILVEGGTDFEVRTSSGDESIGLCIYLGTDASQSADASEQMDLAAPVVSGHRLDPLSAILCDYANTLARDPNTGLCLASGLVRQASAGSQAFLARFAHTRRRLSQAKAATRTEILQRLERARAFIHDHVAEIVTLDQIAREAALSRFHLSHAFCEAYGQPPLTYHRSLRLKDAGAKLRLGAASATELADQLGYASLSAFSRAFKGQFGVPPSHFATSRRHLQFRNCG